MSYLNIVQNSEQWSALIDAIGAGGGGATRPWQKIASDVTTIPWGGLDCVEVLCIVKQTIGQKPATTFVIPYSMMGSNIPIVDGLYYNSNYYYSFGVQSGASNLYVATAWCRGYESGTTISASNFVMDVYIR